MFLSHLKKTQTRFFLNLIKTQHKLSLNKILLTFFLIFNFFNLPALNFNFFNSAEAHDPPPNIWNRANCDYGNFHHSYMSRKSYTGLKCFKANFELANMESTLIKYSELNESNFRNAVGNKVNFMSSQLVKTNFNNARMENSNFYNTNISLASFIGAELSSSNFNKITAYGVNFSKARLLFSELNNSDFYSDSDDFVNFRANFREAQLQSAKFDNSDLREAYFYKANLKSATLTDTNLLNAVFFEANLINANFAGAENLTYEQLKGAYYNYGTDWPGDDEQFEFKVLKSKKLCGGFFDRETICQVPY